VGCVWMLQFQALCSTLCMWDCSACTGNGLHLQETSVKDGMFKPFRQTKVVVPNHPHAREVNWLGGAVDIKTHRWIHCNVRFKGTPEQYAPSRRHSLALIRSLNWAGWSRTPALLALCTSGTTLIVLYQMR
jgi:hypothetical protein